MCTRSAILRAQARLFDVTDPQVLHEISLRLLVVYEHVQRLPDIDECTFPLETWTWHIDENNLRRPHVHGKCIAAYALREGDDPLDYVSSSLLIPTDELISGERLQALADVVIGGRRSLGFNPNARQHSKRMLALDAVDGLDEFRVIFVYTDDLRPFLAKFAGRLHGKIVMTHNSDHGIDDPCLVADCAVQYSQNCCVRHPRLEALPLGIENRQWFDYELLERVRRSPPPRTKQMYFRFSLSTHPSRRVCYDALKDVFVWGKHLEKGQYFTELARHRYAICPRGNGLDCHRVWESLYLGVIPVVVEADDPKVEGLPIVVCRDWQEVAERFADATYTPTFTGLKASKATLGYYRSKIAKLIDCIDIH